MSRFFIPSDGASIELISQTKTELTFRYLNSKTGKKDIKLSQEQLQSMINRNILKAI